MWLFLAFLIVPLVEIALFITIGDIIGLWLTLAVVTITAVLGTWLVRAQGLATLGQLRGSLQQFEDPTEPLAHGAMILFSGALLLTPGFFTDAVGFALLSPAVRRGVLSFLRKHVQVTSFQSSSSVHFSSNRPEAGSNGETIDGDYSEVEPPSNTKPGDSGWTKH